MAIIPTNIKERILEIADYKGIAKEKFFSDLGMSYGNFKGKAKKQSLNSDALAIIVSNYSEVSPEWLLTGKGSMLRGGSSTPDTPPATQTPAEQASPIKIPSSQSDARQLAIHVLDHVKELEQQPIFMSYIKQKAYEIALEIVTEKLSK